MNLIIDGTREGMTAYIAAELHMTIPSKDEFLGIVKRGFAKITNSGTAKWFLSYYADGSLMGAKYMPRNEAVAAGEEYPLEFTEYNI